MAHDSHDGHDDHSHHVLGKGMLFRTFGALVFLTVLTVVLAFMERSGMLPLGPLSVPVALAIAGAKAALVALFFMGLKHDGGTNAVAFVLSIVFLAVFLIFTYLDTGFRDTLEDRIAVPIDIIEAEEQRARIQQDAIRTQFEAQPVLNQRDSLLVGSGQ
ncbi:MAG: cytochrome C oxidase subunit IV family protein [Bacteroidota bacterium]